MKNYFNSVCYLIFTICMVLSQGAYADSDFEAWKKSFAQKALKAGISQSVLDRTLPKMHLQERVIHLDTRKPEFLPNFYDYIRSRLTDTKIETGQKMLQKYPTWLNRIEKQYGVPKEYLVAIWGMETNYGNYMGRVNMLDSLSSLAYHPRRRKFFTAELIAHLKTIQEESSIAPKIGSWDGGFGHFQFMPTTFRAYAVDGDGNGRRDIVNNMPDAFASAANYLSKLGWHTYEPWGREVVLTTHPDWDQIHRDDKKTVAAWIAVGFKPKHLPVFPESEHTIVAELHMPMGFSGPMFLTYPNYRIIRRWNKLEVYGLAVGLLADALVARSPYPTPPEGFKPFRTKSIICLQELLAQQGYLSAKPDGLVGPKTRQAIRSFQRENRQLQDGYPNIELLKQTGCLEDEE